MMKRVFCSVIGMMVVAAAAGAQQPAGQKIGLAMTLQRAYANIKTNLTQSVEKMPEADFNSKPSTMPEVRTFGKLFGHVANAQFGSCAAAKGVPNPNQGNDLETKTTRPNLSRRSPTRSPFATMRFRR
jgi:hypothetical protein